MIMAAVETFAVASNPQYFGTLRLTFSPRGEHYQPRSGHVTAHAGHNSAHAGGHATGATARHAPMRLLQVLRVPSYILTLDKKGIRAVQRMVPRPQVY